MTKTPGESRCRWCGRPVAVAPGRGRPRQYCRQGCRQQAHLARKLAAAHGLGPGDAIVDRAGLEDLHGALYCLQAAIEDVDGDLKASRTKQDLEDALRWLLENARPLSALRIEPRAALDPGLTPHLS